MIFQNCPQLEQAGRASLPLCWSVVGCRHDLGRGVFINQSNPFKAVLLAFQHLEGEEGSLLFLKGHLSGTSQYPCRLPVLVTGPNTVYGLFGSTFTKALWSGHCQRSHCTDGKVRHQEFEEFAPNKGTEELVLKPRQCDLNILPLLIWKV